MHKRIRNRDLWSGKTTQATKALGAPFKPYGACPGAPWGLSGLPCLPHSFVIRAEAYPDFLPRGTHQNHVCGFP